MPLVARVPLQLPIAVQLVALAADQLMVVELPVAMELAVNARVGAGGTTCGKRANAASACTNPWPELKFGVVDAMGNALVRSAW